MEVISAALYLVILLVGVSVNEISANQDLTLSVGATGCVVTKASVDLCETSKIFKKQQNFLLYRVAFASSFGNDLFVPGAAGIWQFTPPMLANAKQAMKDLKLGAAIRENMCVEFEKAAMEDMKKPLFSAIGAFLLLEKNGGAPHRNQLQEQIKFWDKIMGQNIPRMKTEIEKKSLILDENKGEQGSSCLVCTEKPSDIIFMVDESGSIDANDWKLEKQFVETVLARFVQSMANKATKVSLLIFGERVEFSTDYSSDSKKVMADLHSYKKKGGGTNIATANQEATKRVLDTKTGSRKDDKAIRKLAFIVTDGKDNSRDVKKFKEATNELKSVVSVYAIGIKKSADEKQLLQCANGKDQVRIYDTFNQFTSDVAGILYSACKLGATSNAKLESSGGGLKLTDARQDGKVKLELPKLQVGDSRYFKVKFVHNRTMYVEAKTQKLTLNIYISFNQNYPSEANYDLKHVIKPGMKKDLTKLLIKNPDQYRSQLCKKNSAQKDFGKWFTIAVFAVGPRDCKKPEDCVEDVTAIVAVNVIDPTWNDYQGSSGKVNKKSTKQTVKFSSRTRNLEATAFVTLLLVCSALYNYHTQPRFII